MLLALLTAVWFCGCEQKNEFQAPPPPEVTVAQPITKPVVDTVQFTGTTKAVATVNLRARVNGYLKEVKFEDGATVAKDDLLLVIDQAPFQVDLDSAKASLQKAEAEQKLAQTELNRIQRLRDRNVATASELDTQVAKKATADAEIASAKAAVRQAELQLNYTEIRAPPGRPDRSKSGRCGESGAGRADVVGDNREHRPDRCLLQRE